MSHYNRLFFPLVLVILAGCNSKPELIGIAGNVSYGGQPVKNGRIDFIPTDATPGGSAGADILDGRYAIPAAFGVRPNGVYQVRIIGLRKTGKIGMNRTDSGGVAKVELQENFIPAVYNGQSILKLSVSDLSDKTKADFILPQNP